MVWCDYGVFRMSSIPESLAKIGLVRKFDYTLRLWINTRTLAVNIVNSNFTILDYALTNTNNSLTDSVPFYNQLF